MKTCPVCALDLDDSYLFCPDDGSNLETLVSAPLRDAETAVVLYCPTCAAEYPLSFSTCPVHGVQLTRHSIPKLATERSDIPQRTGAAVAQSSDSERHFRQENAKPSRRLTTLDLTRPQIESPRRGEAAVARANEPTEKVIDAEYDAPAVVPVGALAVGDPAFDAPAPLTDAGDRGFERPGFRIAAIAVVIGLAVFGLVAISAFISSRSRRSSAAVQLATKAQASPLPFVATPQEAQDYKEETPAPVASTPVVPENERQFERARSESPSPPANEHVARKSASSQSPLPQRPAATPLPEQVSTARVSNPPMPPLPRGNSGGFDARLIRVRSMKTPAGFRYDLTFNMQEQAGRSTQWQRVLISTRSASGMSHSEAIPFSHHLGATGALTFTISVELTGRSEPDWQGRIVCTTLGWDNKGAPLQASFGANVAP